MHLTHDGGVSGLGSTIRELSYIGQVHETGQDKKDEEHSARDWAIYMVDSKGRGSRIWFSISSPGWI